MNERTIVKLLFLGFKNIFVISLESGNTITRMSLKNICLACMVSNQCALIDLVLTYFSFS